MFGIAKDLKAVLLSIQHDVAVKIPELNNGGCAVFASIVLKELQKRNIKSEAITSTRKVKTPPTKMVEKVKSSKNGEKRCKVWDNAGLDRQHVAIRFKSGGLTYTYDSEALTLGGKWYGFRNSFKCSYSFGQGLTYKQVAAIARDSTSWNKMFDRKHIPELRAIIRKNFREI